MVYDFPGGSLAFREAGSFSKEDPAGGPPRVVEYAAGVRLTIRDRDIVIPPTIFLFLVDHLQEAKAEIDACRKTGS